MINLIYFKVLVKKKNKSNANSKAIHGKIAKMTAKVNGN